MNAPDHVDRYEEIIDRFVSMARGDENIQAAFVVGSRARTDHPADAWSDLDIVIFAVNPAALIDDDRWVSQIDEPLISYREPTAVGIWEERRVLFANGCDVDFSVIPAAHIEILDGVQRGDPRHDEVANVVGRGYRVLLDKPGTLTPLLARLSAAPRPVPTPPSQEALDQVSSDFWHHCVWIAKKLRRGELMVAHECLDGHQRHLLMRLIRWLAEQQGTVWHGTRYMEEWAPPQVMERLPATWAVHTRDDVMRALLAMMDLVAYLTREIGMAYGLVTSIDEESSAREWVRQVSVG